VLWKTGQNKVSVFVKSPKPSLQPPPESNWNLKWTYRDIHPSWTWPGSEGEKLEVVVFSACDEVELFVNSRSLGRKKTSAETKYEQVWNVVYEPGDLKAIGYVNGKKESEWILKTAGAAKEIKLTVDRDVIKADGCDLSYITAELIDGSGNRVYDWNEDVIIEFEVEGEGEIAAVGNANPISTESFKKPHRKTFRGRCIAVLKSTRIPGKVSFKATSEGLKGNSVIITTE
jgi:beta-galactosidase